VILNIRGTSGSGKSTIALSILRKFPHKPLYGILGPRKPEAYQIAVDKVAKPLYLLGPYLTPVGGLDCVQPFNLIPGLIEKYATKGPTKGHVLCEGMLVGKTKGQVGACLEKWGKDAVLIFLTTSLEDCIKSVQARRAAKGNERELALKNITEAFKSTARVRKTLLGEGVMRVIDTPRDYADHLLLKLLREA
jgi:hypothetical protein